MHSLIRVHSYLARSIIIASIALCSVMFWVSEAGAANLGCDCWETDNPVVNAQLFVGGWPAGGAMTLDPHIRVEVTTNSTFVARDRKVDGSWRFSRVTVRAERGVLLRGYDVVASKSLVGSRMEAGKVNVFTLNLTKAQLSKVRALQRLKGVRGVYASVDVVGPAYSGSRVFTHDPAVAFSGGYFSK